MQLVRRPRQCAYLFSETHMCMHTISSQFRMKQAHRLREPNCLFKDESLEKSLRCLNLSVPMWQFLGLSEPLCSISAQQLYSCMTSLVSHGLIIKAPSGMCPHKLTSVQAHLSTEDDELCLISQPYLL